MRSRLLFLIVSFFLATNPSYVLGQTSSSTASQNVKELTNFREGQSDKAYSEYQQWLELLKKATQHQMELNIGAWKLLDNWQAKQVSLSMQTEILLALRKELQELLESLQKESFGQINETAFPRGGNVDGVLGALSALKITIDVAKIACDTQDKISAAILRELDEAFGGSWYDKLTRVQAQIYAVGTNESEFLKSLDDSGYYYLARQFLEKERDALRAAKAEDIAWVGGKLKWSALWQQQERMHPKESINLYNAWSGPYLKEQGDKYHFKHRIWGVPTFQEIWLTVRDLNGQEPKGSYKIDAYVQSMKERYRCVKRGKNSYCLLLWDEVESYIVAGGRLCGTIVCEDIPSSSSEYLRLVISLGYKEVLPADAPKSVEINQKAGDYLINTGLYLSKLRESRLELLENAIFEVSAEHLCSKEVLVGEKGELRVDVTNDGESDIENLWLEMDILAPDGETKVETTRTLSPDNPRGGVGNIFFNYDTQQGLRLRRDRTRTFSCDYSFDESSTGYKYAAGNYTVRYCVWFGPPGDGLQLIKPQNEILTLKPRPEATSFAENPDIRIIQFSQEPYPVELDGEVKLIFTVQNQSDSPLEFGHLEWWICNENGELMNKFEHRSVTMASRESRQFRESIMLTSRNNGGRYTAGTYKILFSACIPSPDEPEAKLVVGNKSNLTFQVIVSREQIANNIRKWIEVIEEDERQALPRIKREEQLRVEERRKEEELEQKIAEHYRKLNEEENAKVRRELEEARDRLTQALLAMASEHQQRRTAAAKIPQPIHSQRAESPSNRVNQSRFDYSRDTPLAVRMWVNPSQLHASDIIRKDKINAMLFCTVSKDCKVEIWGQFPIGYMAGSDMSAFGYVHSPSGDSRMGSIGFVKPRKRRGYTVKNPNAQGLASKVFTGQMTGGKTYSYDLSKKFISDHVHRHIVKCFRVGQNVTDLQINIRFFVEAEGGRTITSDSALLRMVP